jgi:hypothetical protein
VAAIKGDPAMPMLNRRAIMAGVPFASRVRRSAIVRSSPIETSQRYARRFANSVGNHRPVLQLQLERGSGSVVAALPEAFRPAAQFVRLSNPGSSTYPLTFRVSGESNGSLRHDAARYPCGKC